jgi:hypothetical protein
MHAPALQSLRVRCRQIADHDLTGLADFLAQAFPLTGHTYWNAGFVRLRALPAIPDMPRFGYLLESDNGVVGTLLVTSSRRGDRIIASLSGWYVEPNYRAHSALLVAMATKNKNATYLNATPAPHTWRTLQAQYFRPYNFGRSTAFPLLTLGGGRVNDVPPDTLPEREMLRVHDALGFISLVWEKDGDLLPFIFKPAMLDRPRVRAMELIYCRSTADFVRAGSALGRYLFFRHGALAVILDGKVTGMPSRHVVGMEPRYFKGPKAPRLNDLAFTEKVMFPSA